MADPETLSLTGRHGRAVLHRHGGTVWSWQPHGQPDVLWRSSRAAPSPGKGLRGGIPICWPWFGADPAHPERPAHGVVRGRTWQVDAVDEADGDPFATLSLRDDDQTRAIWPHPFALRLTVRVGATLTVMLRCHNPGPQPLPMSGALHTYLAVSSAHRATVSGLGGRSSFNKVLGLEEPAPEPQGFTQPVDRVVRDVGGPVTLRDGARAVEVHLRNTPDVVLWNPGAAHGIADIDDADGFVCVEAARVTPMWLMPGETATLGTRLRPLTGGA